MTLKDDMITDLDALFNSDEFAVEAIYTPAYVPRSAAPITLTDIVMGYPTILKKTAHGLVDDDVVTLANFAGDDADLLNDVETIAQFVTVDTFAVPIDTTGKTITDNGNTAMATRMIPPVTVAITVMFDKDYDSISGVGGFRYHCLAKTADVLNAKPGETIEIAAPDPNAGVYKIKEPPHHTGNGTSEIELTID